MKRHEDKLNTTTRLANGVFTPFRMMDDHFIAMAPATKLSNLASNISAADRSCGFFSNIPRLKNGYAHLRQLIVDDGFYLFS